MSPTFRARKRVRFGPFYVNMTHAANPLVALFRLVFSRSRTRPFTSWGIQVGRWSHNFTRGTTVLNTPGPGSVHWRRPKRGGR